MSNPADHDQASVADVAESGLTVEEIAETFPTVDAVAAADRATYADLARDFGSYEEVREAFPTFKDLANYHRPERREEKDNA